MADRMRRTMSIASNYTSAPPDYDSSQEFYYQNLDSVVEEEQLVPTGQTVLSASSTSNNEPTLSPGTLPTSPTPSTHPSLPHSDSHGSAHSVQREAGPYSPPHDGQQVRAQEVYARAMEEARQRMERMVGLGVSVEGTVLEERGSRVEHRSPRPAPIHVGDAAPGQRTPLTVCGCTCACCLEKCAVNLPLNSATSLRGAGMASPAPSNTAPSPGTGNSDSSNRAREEGKMFSMPLMSIVMPVLMTDEMQKLAGKSAARALEMFDLTALADIAAHVREAFDGAFPDATWHVVVGEDWTWAVTYEKMHYIVFTMKSLRFIIYASPGDRNFANVAIGRVAHPHVASRFPTSAQQGPRIHGTAMDTHGQTLVTGVAGDVLERHRLGRSRPNTIAAEIKEGLSRQTQSDRTLSWHVIVGNDHGSCIAYTQFLHFTIGTLTCLVWKTWNRATSAYRPQGHHSPQASASSNPSSNSLSAYSAGPVPGGARGASPLPPNAGAQYPPMQQPFYQPYDRRAPQAPPGPQPTSNGQQHYIPQQRPYR